MSLSEEHIEGTNSSSINICGAPQVFMFGELKWLKLTETQGEITLPFLAQKAFMSGGVCLFWTPRGRILYYTPPILLYTPHA